MAETVAAILALTINSSSYRPRFILQEGRQRQVALLPFEGMAMSWSSALRRGYGPALQGLALDADLDVKIASTGAQYSQCA
jgi:hypothetical protein